MYGNLRRELISRIYFLFINHVFEFFRTNKALQVIKFKIYRINQVTCKLIQTYIINNNNNKKKARNIIGYIYLLVRSALLSPRERCKYPISRQQHQVAL
jgi:hypothetical protein